MKKEFRLSNRREFLGDGLRSAALLTALTTGGSQAADKAGEKNPFAYDIQRFSRTDPKLIAYEQAARWKSPQPDGKRLAIGPNDQVYVCAGNYVTVLDSQGQTVQEIALSEASRCAAVARDGTLFVGLRDHIEVFDPKGRRTAAWESAGKKSWLTGLAVGEKDVFAADAGARVLLRYDRAGKRVGRIGEKNKERNVPGFVVPSPYLDVELGKDGLLRVNNPGRHQVEIFTVDGDFEGAWGKPTAAITGFCGCCNPVGIAFLPDERLVTCEKGLPRVKVYSLDGQFQCVVAGPESFPENAAACNSLNDCTHGGLDVAADSHGTIYILDFVANDIRVMKRKAKT
jgi:hypothetical protein